MHVYRVISVNICQMNISIARLSPNLCLVTSRWFALAVFVFDSSVSCERRGCAVSPPVLWCSSEPGLISIPDPIHNPGLRDQGPNEEMKHHGKVASQSSKDGRGTAEEALLSVLFTSAYFCLLYVIVVIQEITRWSNWHNFQHFSVIRMATGWCICLKQQKKNFRAAPAIKGTRTQNRNRRLSQQLFCCFTDSYPWVD